MSYVRVFEVKEVTATFLKINPPALSVHSVGMVNSTGWTDPQLTPWIYIHPPEDGVLDMDFSARRPTGIVHWTITPICADIVLADVDIANYWGQGLPLKGVRVHAATNSLQAAPSSNVQAKAANLQSGDRWPW